MSGRIDLDLKDFADEFEIKLRSTRPRRNARGAPVSDSGKASSSGGGKRAAGPATREKVERTVRKIPEVMVKISGGGKNMQRIKAHLDYISRNGAVELEDENGMTHLGREAVGEVRDAWAYGRIGIPEEGERRKEAFNIVLSMPPGTDRTAVKAAAREFAAAQFPTHQYVFAAHDDEKHPHVHLTVKAADRDGIRLNPRKADLQHWRELFAEKLREQGVEANATPRRVRGVVRKAEKQAVRNIKERGGLSKAHAGQLAEAKREAQGGQRRVHPAHDKISARRKAVTKTYGKMAKALVAGDVQDKALALEIVQFVKQMPPPVTLHELLVQQQRTRPDGSKRVQEAKEAEKSKDAGKDRG